jgi:hypothetical protein
MSTRYLQIARASLVRAIRYAEAHDLVGRNVAALVDNPKGPTEEIARLAGHNRTATTELVYRHQLRPVITTGAEVMDRTLNLRG